MKPFVIVLAALWIYPVLSLFIMLPLKERPKARMVMLIIFAVPAMIGVIGYLSGYSTTNENADWLLVSSIYFFICLMIWRIVLHSNIWIRITGIVFALIIFGIGYFNGSMNFLGIAYRMGEYEHNGKIAIDDRLSYTESVIGNATSDYRGKRIEIFANPEHMPFLEYPVCEKSYTDIAQFSTPARVSYNKEANTVIFSIPAQRKGKYRLKGWADTVDLDLYMKK